MPEPVGRGQRYIPGLDGLRALAVVAVVAFHLGVPFVPGGLLGVGVFFTLSGYLITDLLLSSWERTGGLALRTFWARRARRLLPALFMMLGVVSVWAAVGAPSELAQLRGAVLAALAYVSNWWLAFQHISYFARFGAPSPLGHLWSLAVEEQFYLVWPWLLWGGLVWVRARQRRRATADLGADAELGRESAGQDVAEPLLADLAYASVGGRAMAEVGAGRYAPVTASYRSGGPALLGPVQGGAGRAGHRDPERGAARALDGPVPGMADELRALGEMFHGRSPVVAPRAARAPRPPRAPRAARSERLSGRGPRASWASRLGRYLGVPGTRRSLWPLAVATVVLAVGSALEMALLYHPSFDPSRVYDGTDTRAFGLLFGAALAMVWPSTGLAPLAGTGARRLLNTLGWAGLVGIAVLVFATNQYSSFLYRGGLVLLSLATVMVLAAATHPQGRVGAVLGCRPLRWLGVRSYGIYVWHYPVIVLTSPANPTGLDVPRALLQVAATITLADLSWRYVESPIRHGALGRAWHQLLTARKPRLRTVPPARWATFAVVPVALVAVVAALAGYFPSAPPGALATGATGGAATGGLAGAATGGLVGTFTSPTTARSAGGATAATARPGAPRPSAGVVGHSTRRTTRTTRALRTSTTHRATITHRATTTRSTARRATATTRTGTTRAHAHKAVAKPHGPTPTTGAHRHTVSSVHTATAPPGGGNLLTSCKEVVHIGDSTSESLVSTAYLPDPAQRLQAQYARVGVSVSVMRIVGGTSVVETLPGTQDAYQMAQELVRSGYHGCWVVALGTNDAADIYVGSNVGAAARVQHLMSVIGDQPVLWVNVKTLLSSGPYAEANMQAWDSTLVSECSRYPNMRVFNWAGMAQPSWFISDGIHYSSQGSAPRAAAIADALATAFPAGSPALHPAGGGANGCVINGSPTWDLPTFKN